MTNAALTHHGTATDSSETTSAHGVPASRRVSRYAGIAALAKSTALTMCVASNAPGASNAP